MRHLLFLIILFFGAFCSNPLYAVPQEKVQVTVGVPTVLSGDFANLGQNIQRTIETYKKHLLRHKIEFVFEDARISSSDGLKAYQALINGKHVDLIIGGTSSNGTMAGAPLVNASKTVLLTPITGGSNIDQAGEYIFRIGNSDVLNGIELADYFKSKEITKIAMLSEQTEYTQNISDHLRSRLKELGIVLVYDDVFTPGTTDFKSQLARIHALKPQALFIPTQTGVSLALVLKQLDTFGRFTGEIHTTFVAAPNPDARKIAGDLLTGVYYMAPKYDESSPRFKEFLRWYQEDHGQTPDIAFHMAGTVDALDLLQLYLDKKKAFQREEFKNFLLSNVKEYVGLMGKFSFNEKGNSDLGFTLAKID